MISPWATDGVQIALGATNRSDKLVFQADAAEQSGDLIGGGGASVPINNAITVTEEYGEIRVPIIQKMPFVEELSAEGGIRFSKYTNGTKPTTWKAGLQWQPIDDIRVRASYDVAIRAPSILESFSPDTVTNTSLVSVDPCAPTVDPVTSALVPATATLAQCELQGVTPAEYGNGGTTDTIPQCVSGQCAVELGGNQRLGPEKAKTFSVGFTLTPTFIDGFTASVDYFKIDIGNEIAQNPIATVLAECLATGAHCDQIVRNSVGSITGNSVATGGFLVGTFENIASAGVYGVDLQTSYQTDLADLGVGNIGELAFHLSGTLTTADKSATPGQASTDCTGQFGTTCGSPLPKWRHVFRTTWTSPWDFDVSLQWRFFGGVVQDDRSSRIPAISYFDLSGTWNVYENLELRAGINNIFDKDPPLVQFTVAGTGTPNTYNTYDLLGREVFIAFTGKL
jgi:outer membrane receptor protein involved in Fe transport